NPFCVTTDTNATDALNKMVNGGFRHLPCLNAEGDVVGLLDITKCLYEALEKLEKAHQSSKKLADALEGMQADWAQPANQGLQNYVEMMREKMASPDLSTILNEMHDGAAEIQTKTTVREAARLMKLYHTTASLIMDDGRIAGIFTTKDIVVRVMASGLEPDTTSVIRVMTPRPDTVPVTMTILEALKTMHSNHYLHLPVVDEHGRMAGMVDVLQVSFAMLNQMNTMQSDADNGSGNNNSSSVNGAGGRADGPVWNKFWETSFARDDTGSDVSASDVRSNVMPSYQSEIMGGSHHGSSSMVGSSTPILRNGTSTVGTGYRQHSHPHPLAETNRGVTTPPITHQQQYQNQQIPQSPPAPPPTEFTFKFKEPTGEQVHRFMSSSHSFSELYTKIQGKMGSSVSTEEDLVLTYIDEENDQVLIQHDSDVADAVEMAVRNHWALIRLAVTVKVQPQPLSQSQVQVQAQAQALAATPEVLVAGSGEALVRAVDGTCENGSEIASAEMDAVVANGNVVSDGEAAGTTTRESCESKLVLSDESIVEMENKEGRNQESKGTQNKNALTSIVQEAIAGADPLILTGVVGLGVGIGVALLFTMMRK
ncbi:hypothetical protein BG004_002506, partial [Podila humilis]